MLRKHRVRHAPADELSQPLGYDESRTENAVNKVIDDFLVKSLRGNEPTSIKIVVHNALVKLAVDETDKMCDRTGRAADAREIIEEAIEAELRH